MHLVRTRAASVVGSRLEARSFGTDALRRSSNARSKLVHVDVDIKELNR